MDCIFYNNISDRRAIEKTITQVKTTKIVFLDSVSVLYPRITVRELPTNSNYCFIESLGRYYYIEKFTVLKNQLVEIELSEDVLYTFRDFVKQSLADIKESENILNADKIDYVGKNTETKIETDFDDVFTAKSDILITVQGA